MSGTRIWIGLFVALLLAGIVASTRRRDGRVSVKGLLRTERDLPKLWRRAIAQEGLRALRRFDVLFLTLAGAQLFFALATGLGFLLAEAVGSLD